MSMRSSTFPRSSSVADDRPIRVMLVDDHAVVRSGLMAFLLSLIHI